LEHFIVKNATAHKITSYYTLAISSIFYVENTFCTMFDDELYLVN